MRAQRLCLLQTIILKKVIASLIPRGAIGAIRTARWQLIAAQAGSSEDTQAGNDRVHAHRAESRRWVHGDFPATARTASHLEAVTILFTTARLGLRSQNQLLFYAFGFNEITAQANEYAAPAG